MLSTLQVRNFVLVEELRVEFKPGLNIITGETGAGKSILMGSLSLLLGERADKSIIRTGATQSSIESVFILSNQSAMNALLSEAGIDPCQDGQLVLRRVVSLSGGGSFINGCPATLQTLKKVGDLLVDMHGAHEHQSLLSQDFQMDILDAFGGLRDLASKYHAAFSELSELQTALKSLDCDEKTVTEQIDLLSFQAKEIGDAALVEGEEEELKNKHTRITNAQGILDAAQNVCRILTDGESSVIDSLASVQRELERLKKHLPESEQWSAEARSASVQLNELSKTISGCVSDIEDDPKQLEFLESRLAVYHKMRRKYGATVPDILATLAEAKKRLHDLQTRDEQIAAIKAKIDKAAGAVQRTGKSLGKERRSAATELARKITRELQDLGFAKGSFQIALNEVEPCPTGLDAVEFGFAPNLGEAMRPLRMIASSGEISRVMLATKAVLAKHDRIPVLVFDEIDTNVGGEMGFAIGAKLAGIAGSHQVICITHLPQVAVYGDTHFAVAKHVRDERTFTGVRMLEEEDRIDEVARMLGGKSATRLTRDHAREMLARARTERKKPQ